MAKFPQELKDEFEQAELSSIREDSVSLEIRNGALKEISASGISGIALRVVKNGRLGANFTTGSSPDNMGRLADGAEQSAVFGPEAVFDFSRDRAVPGEEPEDVPDGVIIDYARGFLSSMRRKDRSIPVGIGIGKNTKTLSVATGGGGDCSGSSRVCSLHFSAPVPGGSSEISRSLYSQSFFSSFPEEDAVDFIRDYRSSRSVSSPSTGRLPALFSPGALFILVFCLQEGASARNVYLKISPLKDREGDVLFSGKISLRDEPGQSGSPHARSFDDEGVKTSAKDVVKNGVFRGFIYDLNYGARLGSSSSGNGLKSSLFSGGVGAPVSPAFINPVIEAGNDSKEDIVRGIKEGIIVENVIGFHSSNYSQGHFSVQAQGFHVSGGKVRGRLEDVMIAGNIYEDFKNVSALGDRLYCTSYGHAPYMLVEGVSVSGG